MPEENVEIVRRAYEAAAQRDAAAVIALYRPEVEWDISRSPNPSETYHLQRSSGLEALNRRAGGDHARADAAGEIAQLQAANELLAQRDREARDELERLRFTK
jgi:ketosteroid isomerase-like protein